MPYPIVKLDEKHDIEVSELIRPTIIELRPGFGRKCGLEQPTMVLAQFWQQIQIDLSREYTPVKFYDCWPLLIFFNNGNLTSFGKKFFIIWPLISN